MGWGVRRWLYDVDRAQKPIESVRSHWSSARSANERNASLSYRPIENCLRSSFVEIQETSLMGAAAAAALGDIRFDFLSLRMIHHATPLSEH
jgi:hypothetical protein